MPRDNPLKDIDILGKLDIQPVTGIEDYLISKAYEIFLKTPTLYSFHGGEWEMFYILDKWEHERHKQALQDLLKHKSTYKDLSKKRVIKACKDLKELHDRFIDVNEFIREFNEKKKNAQRKIRNEVEEQKVLAVDLINMSEKVSLLKEFRMKLLNTANEYKPYETVLDNALAKTDFRSTPELIGNCDALMLAYDDIENTKKQLLQDIMGMRKQFQVTIKQTRNAFSAVFNELKQNKRNFYKARDECYRWEHILFNTNEVIIENNRRKETVRDGIEHIYRMLCRRSRVAPSLYRGDIDRILIFIEDEVEILKDVIKEYLT